MRKGNNNTNNLKLKNMKTFKAWIIVNGKGTEQISATVKAKNKKEAKEILQRNGSELMSDVYLA